MDQIEELKRQVSALTLENLLYSKYIEKKSIELGESTDNTRRKSKRTAPHLLSIDQKISIFTDIHDDIIAEINTAKISSEKTIDLIKAHIDETDIRASEVKRDIFEFRRDCIVPTHSIDARKRTADKLEKYYTDKTNRVDATIDKLKLKNVSLNHQLVKLEDQVALNHESGQSLHYIDFHQLQIENKQSQATLEAKNLEIIELKLSTAKVAQMLNDSKFQLQQMIEKIKEFDSQIAEREKSLKKLKQDNTRSKLSIYHQNQNLEKLQSTLSLSESTISMEELPDTLEYIKQKKEMYELESAVNSWQRKLDIINLAARNLRRV